MSKYQMIKFVRDSNLYYKKESQTSLNGDEISSFYQALVNETSLSNKYSQLKSKDGEPSDKCKTRTSQSNILPEAVDKLRVNSNILFRHAQNGDIKGVKYCLDNGYDVNSLDPYNWTAVMCASYAGHGHLVEFLLSREADVSFVNSNGISALNLAKKAGHKQIIDLLINRRRNEESKPSNSTKSITTNFFCEICKQEFKETPQEQHERSTVHLFNLQHKQKTRTTYHLTESNIGFQMMLKTGWNKDEGLGPEGAGVKYPLKTFLKRDRLGIGSDHNAKAKITHFEANDTKAIKPEPPKKFTFKTLSRRAREKKMKREKEFEKNFRQLFNEMEN